MNKKILFLACIGFMGILRPARAVEEDFVDMNHVNAREALNPPERPVERPGLWRRLFGGRTGKARGTSGATGTGTRTKGSKQSPMQGQGDDTVTVAPVKVDAKKPLNEEERAAILKTIRDKRPSIWDRFRGKKTPDVNLGELGDSQLDLIYDGLVEKFTSNPAYEVQVDDLKGLKFGNRNLVEDIINTARTVAEKQNRLMAGLTKTSRKNVLRVIDKRGIIKSRGIDGYLAQVKFIVEVEKLIVEELNKLPKSKDTEDIKVLEKIFEEKDEPTKTAAFELLGIEDDGLAASLNGDSEA